MVVPYLSHNHKVLFMVRFQCSLYFIELVYQLLIKCYYISGSILDTFNSEPKREKKKKKPCSHRVYIPFEKLK